MGIDIQQLLDNFSYKPGWKFEYESPDHIYIKMKACADSTGRITLYPEDSLEIGRQFQFHGLNFIDEKVFYSLLLDSIKIIKFHEIDEWFKIGGIAINDPHK